MMRRRLLLRWTVVSLVSIWSLAQAYALDRNEPLAPLPVVNEQDPAKIILGRDLFFDPILSDAGNVSCTSCHSLSQAGTIPLIRATGLSDGHPLFNVPTIFNVANNHRFGWRGEVRSLSAQNEKVILDYNLMATSWLQLLKRLGGSQTYRSRFSQVFGSLPTREAVLDALASFEMSLRTPDAPFDRYLNGDASALSPEALTGYRLFRNYGCASCHQGSNIGGNMIQRLGIFNRPDITDDPGAEAGDTIKEDRGSLLFRVPSLRNVALTAPYFHDGRAGSLPQAISLMGKLQLGRDLSAGDVSALTAFLQSLTGQYQNRDLTVYSGDKP